MKKEVIAIYVYPDLKESVQHEAQKNDRSMASEAKRLIEEALAARREREELTHA